LCPKRCFFLAPEGSNSWFFLRVGWGGLVNAWILEESLEDGLVQPDVPRVEVELWSLVKQIGPGKEMIIL